LGTRRVDPLHGRGTQPPSCGHPRLRGGQTVARAQNGGKRHESAPDEGPRAEPTWRAMIQNSDIVYSATQHIDRLMRRVVLLMFGAGVLAVLAIWRMETVDGTIDAVNRVGYPAMALIFSASYLTLWRYPRVLAYVRCIGFLSISVVLLFDMWTQMQMPGPLLGNYNSLTLWNWLPLCYAMAFFMLQARHAFLGAAAILALFAFCTFIRSNAGTPYATSDRSLMLNTLISHVVLVVCLTGMVWLKHVVAVQGEQATRLNLLAATDPLTGLANRRATLQLLDTLARDCRLDRGPVILLCDLDHFKQINDGWGHAMGDKVLVAVANALRASTRDADTVARWGGEEFLVVLPVTRDAEATELAERLRLRVEALQVADRHQCPVPVTLSIGIARLCADETGTTWLKRADDALYRAKADGRNCCRVANVPESQN
jgi:diguanylate cyclase (GGDEF)-like protein